MAKILPDVLLVAGALCLSYGAWLAWHPAGFMAMGGMSIYAAIKLVTR
jgi:hypothetical protein